MMAGLVRDETMATIRNVDSFPDHKVDAEGNPIRSSHTHGQGQVQGRAKDVPEHLHGGQVLRGMGEDTHQRELPSDP